MRTRATRALRKERDSLESKVQESTRELQSANRSLMEDLVARMRLQEQLSDRDQRLRLLIDGIQDDSVMILDHDGKVVSRSAGSARIIGYRSEEIVGRNHACFYTAEAIERKLPEKHLQIARIDRRVEDQGWRVRKDATAFWANVIITTLSDVENKPKGFVSVARDMTERKRVEALEESERQTIEFLAMLGHELRNPLAPIGNALGLMKIRPTDQRTQEWSRSVIDRQVVHGRVDAVADRRARAFFGAQVRRRALLVDADLARLSQVLINLLNNAAKYTPGRRPSHGQPARRSWCESVTARSA